MPPPVESEDKPDENGITEAMLEFSWERDVQPQVSVRRVPLRVHGRAGAQERERRADGGRAGDDD